MTRLPSPPEDFRDLCRISAEFGTDKMHIQGAGGNSSLKEAGVMWIKASGTVLADAEAKDIFVATDLTKMQRALDSNAPHADTPAEFLLPGGSTLRPSIETSLHAVFPHRVVLHTHCIHTLAHAIRQDGRAMLADKLSAFDWAYVDYAKPGADLARSVRTVLTPDTNVIVLGNHGLIVAGSSADEVRALQYQIHDALAVGAGPEMAVTVEHLQELVEGSDYCLPEDTDLHQIALDPQRVSQVATGSLYPDHVIFCGIAVAVVEPGDTLEEAARRITKTGATPPPWMIVPGSGVVVRRDAERPALVMMRCLTDVMARVPVDAPLTYLSLDQNFELLNWDAEKYRQQLNAS